jgi:hypothetical protein
MTAAITDLVTFGMQRAEEAERRGAPYIVVEELYAGSTRISSRIEEHRSVVDFLRQQASQYRRAFVILQNFDFGWTVSDFLNVVGDRVTVNAHLGRRR